jgi:hypothetical protein
MQAMVLIKIIKTIKWSQSMYGEHTRDETILKLNT